MKTIRIYHTDELEQYIFDPTERAFATAEMGNVGSYSTTITIGIPVLFTFV